MSARALVAIILTVSVLFLWPILLPILYLVVVPGLYLAALACVVGAVRTLLQSAWRRDRGKLLESAQSLSFAFLCGGFLLILNGISLNVDSAMAGPPPSAEERVLGRQYAYRGGWISGLSAFLAYGFDRARQPKVLPEPAEESIPIA